MVVPTRRILTCRAPAQDEEERGGSDLGYRGDRYGAAHETSGARGR